MARAKPTHARARRLQTNQRSRSATAASKAWSSSKYEAMRTGPRPFLNLVLTIKSRASELPLAASSGRSSMDLSSGFPFVMPQWLNVDSEKAWEGGVLLQLEFERLLGEEGVADPGSHLGPGWSSAGRFPAQRSR